MPTTSARMEPGEPRTPLLSEILSSLSFALDLTEGAVPGHSVRSCLLALRLGRALGLPQHSLSELYFAALLKDVGCSSNAARMCQIIGGDDRAVKAGVKLEDWTKPHRPSLSAVKMLWQNILPGASAGDKLVRLLKIGATQHENNREMIEMRCDRGASIVGKIGFGSPVVAAVRHLDEHWDGTGYPGMLRGNAIPLYARILLVAQNLDAFASEQGTDKAIAVLQERSRRWFDPQLVRAAEVLDRSGKLWEHCRPGDSAEDAHIAVLRLEAGGTELPTPGTIDGICEAFAEVVDAKSPFTFRHSMGVKEAAMRIGREVGLSPARMVMLRRAALLHDVGKLSVSNMILDKPGRLDAEEFTIIKRHAAFTREILSRMESFGEIAVLAGEHHERLDGRGYPFGLGGQDLSFESRLLAVADVYGALAENRPYRPGLDGNEISRILTKDAGVALDGDCVDAAIATHVEEPAPVLGEGLQAACIGPACAVPAAMTPAP